MSNKLEACPLSARISISLLQLLLHYRCTFFSSHKMHIQHYFMGECYLVSRIRFSVNLENFQKSLLHPFVGEEGNAGIVN